MGFRGSEVQRFRGLEVQRFRGLEVQRFRGSEVQRFTVQGLGAMEAPASLSQLKNRLSIRRFLMSMSPFSQTRQRACFSTGRCRISSGCPLARSPGPRWENTAGITNHFQINCMPSMPSKRLSLEIRGMSNHFAVERMSLSCNSSKRVVSAIFKISGVKSIVL